MEIDAKSVAELRRITGAGMMDAKKALEECAGDVKRAVEELRKKGVAKAAKRADRQTKEGRVCAYIHSNGKVGALVEVLCETDFVARNESFGEFCHDLAMQVVAAEPLYLLRQDVPAEVIEKEREIVRAEMVGQNKPAEMLEKIIDGKMDKYYAGACLLEQEFIKDDSKTIDAVLKEKIATIGENIQISKFVRFDIG